MDVYSDLSAPLLPVAVGSNELRLLQEVADSTPLIKEVRGQGLIIGIQLRDQVDANMFVFLCFLMWLLAKGLPPKVVP